jgi:cobalt-zinc-cadmium efflux system outer membrane protein
MHGINCAFSRRVLYGVGVTVVFAGCTLAPRGWEDEQRRLASAGRVFEALPAHREMPPLPATADWRGVLQRAFLANGDLEAAYFDWKAALERVGIASAYPNTNVAVGYEYLFSGDNLKAWNRSTFNVGFDPMENLSFPTKVVAAGRLALADARAAAQRFAAAKFDLQRRVLDAYVDYALLGVRLGLQEEQVQLLRAAVQGATARVETGAPQQELLAAEVQLHLAENERRDLETRVAPARARLNALMGRDVDAALAMPATLERRPLAADDAQVLRASVGNNPELAALAEAAIGRADALDLARQQYIPDINPFAGFTGSVEQVAGAMLILPTTWPKISRAVEEARAALRQSDALLRQARLDRAAGLVAALYAMRNSERQTTLFESQILPAADLARKNARDRYSAGAAALADLIESERALLDARLAVAEAQASREQRLAEVEALMGVDVETLDTGVAVAAITRMEVVP